MKRRADTVKGRGPGSVRRGSTDSNKLPTPDFEKDEHISSIEKHTNVKTSSHNYSSPLEDSLFGAQPPRTRNHGYRHSNSLLHPSAAIGNSQWETINRSIKSKPDLRAETSQKQYEPTESSMITSAKQNEPLNPKESEMGFVQIKKRIHYSGPLVPRGGNLEDVLQEHERQIQQEVRKARLGQARNSKGYDNYS
ncbi:hypothetical protein G4B88_006971 [Cannabis sativa]|uniref:Uncharacterized protein n=1 Tax=Cannabis sativa TaxID=3483 RepID=A0A7J6DLD8_CANSA|nr:hypothetical protein G4B88_006971 [Cannabis sativa]